MVSMKPITSGTGEEKFTLFFPFSIRDNIAPFGINILIELLNQQLPDNITCESVEGKGIHILKISKIQSHAEAVKMFGQLKRIFLYLSIENDVAIYTYDSLLNINELPFHFPPDWQDGINAGWKINEKSGLIEIDGVANIVYPVIVPEQKKIVETGTMVGRIQRKIKYETIHTAIHFSKIDRNKANYEKGELASKAYINAFSHENISLRFLSLVTCLEILAETKEKNESYKKAVELAVNAINKIEIYEKEEIIAIQSISSFVGKLKNQSIQESLVDLIDSAKSEIKEALPMDHPHKNNPKDAVRDMYALRSKVAHSASLGERIKEKVHRSLQFVQTSSKLLLKKSLYFS